MNKKKQISRREAVIAFFAKFFGKKEVPAPVLNPDEKINVRVHRLDEEGEYMHSALGITQERAHEIGMLVAKQLKEGNNCAVGVMEEASKDLTHPNEIVLAVWILRTEIDKMKGPMGGMIGFVIEDIMKDIKKRRKDRGQEED